jgi:hypothetical protein
MEPRIAFDTLLTLIGGRYGHYRTTCPLCSHLRSLAHQRQACLSVWHERHDFINYVCHNCTARGHAIANTAEVAYAPPPPFASVTSRGPSPVLIWSQATADMTRVEAYLRNRGIDLDLSEFVDRVFRWHPSAYPIDKDTRCGCLVAAFTDINSGKLRAIHRTAIKDHAKIGCKYLGPKAGSVLRLDPEAGPTLTIAEGLETALAVKQLGAGPTCCVGDAEGMASLPVVSGVERLIVAVDHDRPGPSGYAGQRAAAACAMRWAAAGRTVDLLFDPTPGNDLADFGRVERQRFDPAHPCAGILKIDAPTTLPDRGRETMKASDDELPISRTS